MIEKKNILIYAGLKQYEDELQNLRVVKRKEAARKARGAREQGDLFENAEYDATKDEQGDIELRIGELEKLLRNAGVVIEDEIDPNEINVDCRVRIYEIGFDKEMGFRVVDSIEAGNLQNRTSNESPVGQALIGRKVGGVVDVEAQVGVIQYKVLETQRIL